jgi:uncharacterized OsmC-like protein
LKIELHGETDLSVSEMHLPGVEIIGETEALHYSALKMFVASLAWCTWAVLATYGERIDAAIDDLHFRMRWRYAEKPTRISNVSMDITWPSLPESRLDAAMRAAAMCTVHNTLHHDVEIDTNVER